MGIKIFHINAKYAYENFLFYFHWLILEIRSNTGQAYETQETHKQAKKGDDSI